MNFAVVSCLPQCLRPELFICGQWLAFAPVALSHISLGLAACCSDRILLCASVSVLCLCQAACTVRFKSNVNCNELDSTQLDQQQQQ